DVKAVFAKVDPNERRMVHDGLQLRVSSFSVTCPVRRGGPCHYLWSERFLISREGKKDIDRRGAAIDTYGFAIFWLIVIFGFALTQSLDLLVLFWLVPYLTTFQALGWFIELAEHSPMCETEAEDVYLTRNRKGNLIERLLVGANLDEYHLEHHLSPGVPFWHLKRAQKIRLRDPRYAEVAESWGGLFASGPKGRGAD
ncbi:fatty acid desaturase, partial [Burkholderia sp. JPY481]